MTSNRGKLVDRVQIVLYVLFLFLWFVSPNEPVLRVISLVLLVCFSLFQVVKIIRRKKLFFAKPILFYILFVFWALFSIIWAQDQSMAIARIMDLLCNALFLIISYDFFSDINMSKKTFISIFVIVGFLFTMYVFMHYGFDRYFSMLLAGRRVGGDIINVNFIGVIATMTIIIILYSVLNNIYKNKLVLLLLVPLLVVALGSGSKKVLVGLVMGVLLIFIFYLKGKLTWKKVSIMLLSFVLLMCSIFAISKLPYFNTVFDRMGVMFATLDKNSSIEGGSTEDRKNLIEGGFRTFLDYPVTGIGLNNSGIITERIINTATYLHCNYIELLACLGAVGFVLYYTIYFIIISMTIRSNKGKAKKEYLPIIMVFTLLAIEVGCVTYYEIKTAMYFTIMFIIINKQKWIGEKKDDLEKENN